MSQTVDFIKNESFSPHFDLEKQYANYHGALKNAVEGKVVTRFPPQPSGYLHIGHVKAALLNFHYAKMYKGQMILRFDDTNPAKEKQQYVDSIIDDLHTLGVTFSKLTYTSDYFDKIHNYARELINKNLAYVDNTPVEQMRQERQKKIESKSRDLSIEQNLEIFEKMVAGKADDYCLRAKIDMKSDNGCMRDPVLARVYKLSHQRTGKKYCLYPTYDFACPIVDSLEGVTHTLRTNQYADRIPQYQWVLKACGFPKLEIYEFSRLNLEYTVLSKRKLQWFVDSKRVQGWNDPRFPTVRGVLRKGIRVETLTQFMLEQGPSKKSNLMEWEKIWAINKRIIDPICPRYNAVSLEKLSTIVIANGPKEPEAVITPLNKLNLPLGNRPLWKSSEVYVDYSDVIENISAGTKVTLMNWGNVMIHSKEQQPDGSFLMKGQFLQKDTDFKTTKKITWLAKDSNLLRADLIEYDHLIKTPKVEENQDFQTIVNEKSKFVTPCLVDCGVRTMNENAYLQFQRRGYFKIDKINKEGDDYVYQIIYTPDGKKKGLSSIAKQSDIQGLIKKQDLAEKVQNKKTKGSKKDKKNKKEGGQEKVENSQEKKEEEKPTTEVKQENTQEPVVTEQQTKVESQQK